MNINESMQKLKAITGLDVAPDVYSGKSESYIVYSYTSEKPVLWGDDRPLYDEAEIEVDLYTTARTDYMSLKHKIRNYLETLGEVSEIFSWIDTYTAKNNLEVTKRNTAFAVTITKGR